jgi:hypothetical protein
MIQAARGIHLQDDRQGFLLGRGFQALLDVIADGGTYGALDFKDNGMRGAVRGMAGLDKY